ncbi:agarase, partial [Paenibacillus sp. GYB003]
GADAGESGGGSGGQPVQAAFAGDAAAFYRGNEAAGRLAASAEQASLAYTGARKFAIAGAGTGGGSGGVTLSAQVVQEPDGSLGELAGLPVRFTVSAWNPDGSLSPVAAVADAVYATDAAGVASAAVGLPSGLYQVKARLLGNGYYTPSETTADIAVFESAPGAAGVNGHIDLTPGGDPLIGTRANKLHVESRVTADGRGVAQGTMRVHAEPQGADWTVSAFDWLVLDGERVYAQGVAVYEGDVHTVRLMARDGTVTLAVWKGTDLSSAPVFVRSGERLQGSVRIER